MTINDGFTYKEEFDIETDDFPPVSFADEDETRLARPDYGQAFLGESLWSEILPGLWQGGTDDYDEINSSRIKPLNRSSRPAITVDNFDTVITLYAWANPVDWFVREFRYGVWDSRVEDLDLEELFDLVKIAHSDWKKGKRVLIRCQAGWNRSGLVTALVLMRDGYEAADAIELIRQQRSDWALCNPEFEKFLLDEDPERWAGSEFPRSKQEIAENLKHLAAQVADEVKAL